MNRPPNWKRLRSGELDWQIFHARARILKAIRTFFDSRGYLEIEAPLLTPWPTLDANILSVEAAVQTDNRSLPAIFLHTSPEHAMKKLLVSGAEKIYYLGKVFRNNELTSRHNPEFTMAEWYRTGASCADLQKETADLIRHTAESVFHILQFEYQGRVLSLAPEWDVRTICALFLDLAGIDLSQALDRDSLYRAALDANFPALPGDDWETLFFKIYLQTIEPCLGFPRPVFLTDYPARMGMMAKRKIHDPDWVERTELYIAGLELANGYTELTDPAEQRDRFLDDLDRKKAAGFSNYRMDEELLDAMQSGLPPSAGMALGVDRLVMFFLDRTDIQDVILFPLHQQ